MSLKSIFALFPLYITTIHETKKKIQCHSTEKHIPFHDLSVMQIICSCGVPVDCNNNTYGEKFKLKIVSQIVLVFGLSSFAALELHELHVCVKPDDLRRCKEHLELQWRQERLSVCITVIKLLSL